MRLPYGTGSLRIPDRFLRGAKILRPSPARPVRAPTIRRILRGLARWARSGRRVLVVVPDRTRYAAVERTLPILRVELNAAGVPDSAIHVLFANGLHKAPSRKERRDIVGPEIARVWPLVAHDPKRGCARIGSVEVAKPVLEADRVILLSSAGFHYLAGYGGGWKLLFPGCASERTILALHRRTLESGAEPGRLPGNPFRRAIREAGALIPTPTRSLHVVLDEHRKVVAAESGAPESSLRTIAKKVSQLFEVRIRNRADLVIASAGGHPKDIDLIQSHKAIHYAARALRPGGQLIMLAECPAGTGWPRFERWFEPQTPEHLRKALLRRFHTYGRTAWSLRTKALRYRIHLVSSMRPERVRRMHMEPAEKDMGTFARPISGHRTYIIPEAGSVLPTLR